MRPGSIRPIACGLLLGVTALAFQAHASDECGDECGGDTICAREKAACLIASGSAAEAVSLLKEAMAADPADGRGARLLALAYLELGNRVWAIKSLLAQLQVAPDDFETRDWAVWLLIQDGDLAQAEHLLEQIADIQPGPLGKRTRYSRTELLRAVLDQLSGRSAKAEKRLRGVEDSDQELFPEDIALLKAARSQIHEVRREPINVRVLYTAGYTTNAVQSAPQDVGRGQQESGAHVQSLDLVLRVEPWTSAKARPIGEIRSKGFMPFSDEARDFGYLNLGTRIGGELGRVDSSRLRLLYSYELLGLVKQGWFSTAHRGELELDLLPWFQVFGGVGRRIYQHLPRTRTELDEGLAVVFPLGSGWNITGIVAGRVQFARHEAFDDRGITGLLRVRAPLPADMMIKARIMVLYDYFPYSREYYGDLRRDLMLKAEIGPWSPSFYGIRVGATYSLAHRKSTIDNLIDNFNYTDHRVLLQVRWQGSFDPTLPDEVYVAEDHLALPYGFEETGDTGLDRVQDLLRQEDSARRGSMCVD